MARHANRCMHTFQHGSGIELSRVTSGCIAPVSDVQRTHVRQYQGTRHARPNPRRLLRKQPMPAPMNPDPGQQIDEREGDSRQGYYLIQRQEQAPDQQESQGAAGHESEQVRRSGTGCVIHSGPDSPLPRSITPPDIPEPRHLAWKTVPDVRLVTRWSCDDPPEIRGDIHPDVIP